MCVCVKGLAPVVDIELVCVWREGAGSGGDALIPEVKKDGIIES